MKTGSIPFTSRGSYPPFSHTPGSYHSSQTLCLLSRSTSSHIEDKREDFSHLQIPIEKRCNIRGHIFPRIYFEVARTDIPLDIEAIRAIEELISILTLFRERDEPIHKGRRYDHSARYLIFTDKLKQYCEFLIPELTMTNESKYVLIISCDGMKQGIPFAEKLTSNLREFDNWIILKFRQPAPMEFIPINGLNLWRSSILLEWRKILHHKNIKLHFL